MDEKEICANKEVGTIRIEQQHNNTPFPKIWNYRDKREIMSADVPEKLTSNWKKFIAR